MQDLIKKIVDMDEKARQITDAAQMEKINSEKEVAEKREKIREEYLARARKRIAVNEPQERAAAEESWQKVKAQMCIRDSRRHRPICRRQQPLPGVPARAGPRYTLPHTL